MSNYAVGLINDTDTCEVYPRTSYESAKKQFEKWKMCFLCNNNVKHRTTIIERDCHDEIESIRIVFTTNTNSKYILFLSKCELTSEPWK